MKTALAIRHIGFEDLGYFEAPLIEAGYAVRYVEADTGDLASVDAAEPALLVILGGPMGVCEQALRTIAHKVLAEWLRLNQES